MVIISFLRDEAQEWANDFYEAILRNKNKYPNTGFPTAVTFLDLIKKSFSDPKGKDNKLSKMLRLCYTNGPTHFVHTFCHLAKPLDTSKEEKKGRLCYAIAQSLKAQILHHQADTFKEQLLNIQLWGPKGTIKLTTFESKKQPIYNQKTYTKPVRNTMLTNEEFARCKNRNLCLPCDFA
jgi:hypothetical protein